MKILFIARHYSYLRLFESAIAELAARGHTLTLAADRQESMGGRAMVERLAARYPGIHLADAPTRTVGAWATVARWLRLGLDHLRFVDRRYEATPHLRARVRERAPWLIVWLAGIGVNVRFLRAVLAAFERSLPVPRDLEQFLEREAPDLVLITPLIDIGSPQIDHLAAAKRRGLRTALPVGSWDHLSSKSLLRDMPDRLLVWNEVQRREAVDFHGAPADRVIVTGAQAYDQWFGRRPSRSRDEFCRRVGLPPDRPFLLYVCSSLFRGTAFEPSFIDAWVRAIRSSDDPRVRGAGILIRPHPARRDEWSATDLSGYRDVAFWGAHPVDDEAKDDYFESLFYSAAVVGLNTSAFIEAAVVGKPVHTVLLPDISRDNQEGTLHFHYLLEVNGGLLYTSRTFDEHIRALGGTIAAAEQGGALPDPRAERFVDGFVRPYGRDIAATPRFADAIEEMSAIEPAPAAGRSPLQGLAYLVLYAIAAATAVRLNSDPWRKRTKHRLRKWYQRQRALFFRGVKTFVVERMTPHKAERTPTAAEPSALTPKVGYTRHPSKTAFDGRLPEAKETRELVQALASSGKPIILGPWLSETGFELLYWIPFLAWAKAYGNLDPNQLVVVSRGGAAEWYSHVTPNYEEIFAFYSPEEFRRGNEERIREQAGRLKHVGVSAFDRAILERVRATRHLAAVELLHPSQMYNLFDNFWHQRVPMSLVEAFTVFTTIPDMQRDAGGLRQLPAEYVAAKFYGNAALPPTPENRAFVTSFLADLAEEHEVVLLNTGQQFDDHSDFPPALRGRIHTIDHLMTPQNNLAVQTQVIRGARAFVGTYGGFSYLAPLCGVNTLAFYSHPGAFRFDHLEVAKRVFSGLRAGAFVEMDLRAVDTVRLGFGRQWRALASRT